jgi:hypothetical protein
MTKSLLSAVLAFLLVAAPGLCQPPGPPREGREGEAVQEMERRVHELEFQEREADVAFNREMRELELQERRRQIEGRGHHGGRAFPCLVFFLVVNILLTIWVYQDIRKRGAGSGLWIAITLLAGFFGALLYAVVRLGDIRQSSPE